MKIRMNTKLWYLTILLVPAVFVSCGSGKNVVGTPEIKQVIASTKWLHIKTIDATTKEDITVKYPQFAGIGVYNADGSYEFFTADNKPKGDKGTWFITDNNTVMKITSSTFGYSVSPQLEQADKNHLNFRITVRDNAGKEPGEVIAIHIPYKEK